MASEDMSLVASKRLQNGLVYRNDDEEALRFNCVVAPSAESAGIPKTRDLSGFIDERFFAATPDFRRGMYSSGDRPVPRIWNGAEGSEEDEEDDEDEDDVDDDVDDEEGKGSGGNNAGNGEGIIGNGKLKCHSDHLHNNHQFGGNVMTGGEGSSMIAKEASTVANIINNVVSIAENSEGYLSQFYQRGEGSRQKDSGAENSGCGGYSGRREACLYSNESGDSLRAILSDPLTGGLMDDAMILPCGHSFGGGGIQHVVRMKACYTCSRLISEDSAAPNLSLRAAVQAFRREEESQSQRSAKRKRERFDQDKAVYGDSNLMELPRGRGVQFPFALTDRVIIKGNKRTPQRFVGREAVVTTQCLNGWYVVKTLDNAESVKLQYRSLAKISEDPLAKPVSTKLPPNWL